MLDFKPIPDRSDPAEGLDVVSQGLDDDQRYLARALADAFDSHEPLVAEALPDLSFRQGLAVQRNVLRHHIDRGARLGGWKVGLTSGPNRDRMGTGFRPFGYILADRIRQSPATIQLADMVNCSLEPELCLVLGDELRGPCTPGEAREAVGAVCASFEVNEQRVERGVPSPILLADDLANWGIITGEQIEPPSDDLTMTRVVFECDSVVVGDAPPGEVMMDEPYVSLSRLASELAAFGEHLHRGDRVITGAFFREPIEKPGHWRATFDRLGTVEAIFE